MSWIANRSRLNCIVERKLLTVPLILTVVPGTRWEMSIIVRSVADTCMLWFIERISASVEVSGRLWFGFGFDAVPTGRGGCVFSVLIFS